MSRLAGFQMPTQLLSHFPTSAGQRQKTRLKAHGSRYGQRNCFVTYCHGQNRLCLGKGDLICWQLQEGWQERTAKLKTLSISSSQVQFHFISESCIPSPPQAVQGDGEQGLCSIHDCSSLPLHPFPLFLCSPHRGTTTKALPCKHNAIVQTDYRISLWEPDDSVL